MPQFSAYANPRASRLRAPYLLDMQSNLVDLSTRVFAPLIKASYFGEPMPRLNPVFELDGEMLVLSPAEMTAILVRELGAPITQFDERRTDILAALDLLFTGV